MLRVAKARPAKSRLAGRCSRGGRPGDVHAWARYAQARFKHQQREGGWTVGRIAIDGNASDTSTGGNVDQL